MELTVVGKAGEIKGRLEGRGHIDGVYSGRYRAGDRIRLAVDKKGFYRVCFEDTMGEAVVFIEKEAVFSVPFGTKNRTCYNPRSFRGEQHRLSARSLTKEEAGERRNLALNPYDLHGETGMWPHARANVETRNEALFAARNAIDGIFANEGHYPWPFQSWGINRDPEAALTVFFGLPVVVDEIRLTLRADFPHDSYWTRASLYFSDGTKEVFSLKKTSYPQRFSIAPRRVESLVLRDLKKAGDESPFPALTQLEAWGVPAGY